MQIKPIPFAVPTPQMRPDSAVPPCNGRRAEASSPSGEAASAPAEAEAGMAEAQQMLKRELVKHHGAPIALAVVHALGIDDPGQELTEPLVRHAFEAAAVCETVMSGVRFARQWMWAPDAALSESSLPRASTRPC
jgi:hypothetical protein